MTDPKNTNIFNQTFLLDSQKHPVGTRLIRLINHGWGQVYLIESVIEEWSPAETAVLITNSLNLTEEPNSKGWYEVVALSKTIFDIIDKTNKVDKVNKTPEKKPQESNDMPNQMGYTVNFISTPRFPKTNP